MKAKNLILFEENVLGGNQAWLMEIRPSYVWQDNKQTDKLDGYNLKIVCFGNRYEHVTVKASEKPSISNEDIETSDDNIVISFMDFTVSTYYSNKEKCEMVSCKAKSVVLVTTK
ncbi:MAG: hypothetical protein ACERKN_19180 [Velocimicrobium sp.]